MAARVSTKAEVLAFVDAGPQEGLQAGWVHEVYDNTDDETFQYVNEDGGSITGFGILAHYPEGKADPVGWYLAYVWNEATGPVAWDMAAAGIDDFAALGHTFIRDHCLGPALCGNRCVPYVGSVNRDNMPYPPGTAGYYAVPGEWFMLSEGSHKGEVLYMVKALDPTPPPT